MSIDKAKELIKKLNEDETLKAAFEKDAKEAFDAGDYGCTFDEFKEAAILNRELDDEELAATSGGTAEGPGGCEYNWYIKECAATVEKGSWCGSNDWCDRWDVVYSDRTSNTVCGGGPGIG